MTRDAKGVRDVDAVHRLVCALLPEYQETVLSDVLRQEVAVHLRACASCAREDRLTRAAGDRLRRLAVPPVPDEFRVRLATIVAAHPTASPSPALAPAMTTSRHRRAMTLMPWGGWLTAAALLLVFIRPGSPPWAVLQDTSHAIGAPAPAGPVIPMVAGMVADYNVRMVGELPGGAADVRSVIDSMPFRVHPLTVGGARIIGAWTTTVRGEPAAAIAYRWRDRVVVQYVVSDKLFFHHPDVRASVASRGLYTARAGELGVLAWHDSESGSVLVGSLAPDELARLRT